ncbi:MAG: methyltetrahydrofolate cobalamin methyltransferase [Lachnospiraceae bacterium]|jgi:5-methyltetrahydrofolate--homocysteine methyltransferase|uniref:methyltetrahydrofolate cobalamin methyltransferase n=1 Tax=Clostridium sp. (strain SY8519) TaxID=1042156 RepID=UPI0002171D21|nr:methyltetrahydrofolate cobalamin methyltransferase [Clostridium sp. SY8519]MCI1655893.1 methyltetrahydrofolate cobalamin methyltransferase [Lachnospiraceae bacterium]MCI1658072.1 methyltetrahydrofolate cobalamin methyltransferase [Lachnospiraceae bacterium]MCI2196415.1 methyltetrahydrofolate cobalamin methyltransferase [Lachnospiraceae bacterium]BAK48224.1 hypothetical protein CXIVA_22570 [Clostridium sp. SY8519]
MIIIGEKLNGAIPSMAKAIEARDADHIRDLAKRQTEGGADFIDVCSSVVEGDTEVLKWMIELVQEVSDARICIDSPNAHSIVDVMKYCSKPGLINSVSLEGDKIDTVFPVIADTDWEVIALLCDNNKIPDGIEDREQIFDKIMEKANEYHIAPERIHIDPLVFSVGTKPDAFTNFAEVTKYVKDAYPDIHVTSGLSNISFGLPSRKTINQAFLVLAMAAGMDSAIMDPTNRNMLGALYATEALLEKDEFCIEYIEAYQADLFGVQKK